MAYLVFKTGVKIELSRERAEKLWNALQDPSSVDEDQRNYLSKIKTINLNWRNAPDSYIQENLDSIIPNVLHDWMVDKDGYVTRPGTPAAWEFARRWGLWEYGRPTELASQHAMIAPGVLTPKVPVRNFSEPVRDQDAV